MLRGSSCLPLGLLLACSGPSPTSSETGGQSRAQSGGAAAHPRDDSAADDQPCETQTYYADDDGDGHGAAPAEACEAPYGFVTSGDDCDDTRFDVHPGAAEVCDGADHDCDGTAGNGAAGAPVWYRDADGDGFGVPAGSISACVAPAGHAPNETDCDDHRADVNPAAMETCDRGDEDCDGLANDADPWVSGGTAWYPDRDADGYGAADSTPTWACAAPDGMVGVEGDCDDTDPAATPLRWYPDTDRDGYGAGTPLLSCWAVLGYSTSRSDCNDREPSVNPGALEACAGGWDDDCDGELDEPDATGCVVYYADRDGDGAAGEEDPICACSVPDGYPATEATDCNDADAAVSPAASEVCGDDVDDDCSGGDECDTTTAVASWGAETSGDLAGAALLTPGDVNGDGAADLVITAYDRTTSDVLAGEVYVVSLADRGALTLSGAELGLTGVARGTELGRTLGYGCDLDGDGLAELVAASSYADDPGTNAGAAWGWEAPVTDGDVSTASWWLVGDPGDAAGASVQCLESGALAVGSMHAASGRVDLFETLSAGAHTTAEATISFVSDASSRAFYGAGLLAPGDLDGDGIEDLVVRSTQPSGSLDVYFGPFTGVTYSSDRGALLAAGAGEDPTGALLVLPDRGGDGLPDLLVGDPGLGAVYILDHPVESFEGFLLAAAVTIVDDEPGGAGTSAMFLGDAYGGTGNDVVIGAPDSRDGGKVSMYTLPTTGALTSADVRLVLSDPTISASFGATLASTGDLDGDGWADFIVGAPDEGVTWLFLAGDLFP